MLDYVGANFSLIHEPNTNASIDEESTSYTSQKTCSARLLNGKDRHLNPQLQSSLPWKEKP